MQIRLQKGKREDAAPAVLDSIPTMRDYSSKDLAELKVVPLLPWNTWNSFIDTDIGDL